MPNHLQRCGRTYLYSTLLTVPLQYPPRLIVTRLPKLTVIWYRSGLIQIYQGIFLFGTSRQYIQIHTRLPNACKTKCSGQFISLSSVVKIKCRITIPSSGFAPLPLKSGVIRHRMSLRKCQVCMGNTRLSRLL